MGWDGWPWHFFWEPEANNLVCLSTTRKSSSKLELGDEPNCPFRNSCTHKVSDRVLKMCWDSTLSYECGNWNSALSKRGTLIPLFGLCLLGFRCVHAIVEGRSQCGPCFLQTSAGMGAADWEESILTDFYTSWLQILSRSWIKLLHVTTPQCPPEQCLISQDRHRPEQCYLQRATQLLTKTMWQTYTCLLSSLLNCILHEAPHSLHLVLHIVYDISHFPILMHKIQLATFGACHCAFSNPGECQASSQLSLFLNWFWKTELTVPVTSDQGGVEPCVFAVCQ